MLLQESSIQDQSSWHLSPDSTEGYIRQQLLDVSEQLNVVQMQGVKRQSIDLSAYHNIQKGCLSCIRACLKKQQEGISAELHSFYADVHRNMLNISMYIEEQMQNSVYIDKNSVYSLQSSQHQLLLALRNDEMLKDDMEVSGQSEDSGYTILKAEMQQIQSYLNNTLQLMTDSMNEKTKQQHSAVDHVLHTVHHQKQHLERLEDTIQQDTKQEQMFKAMQVQVQTLEKGVLGVVQDQTTKQLQQDGKNSQVEKDLKIVRGQLQDQKKVTTALLETLKSVRGSYLEVVNQQHTEEEKRDVLEKEMDILKVTLQPFKEDTEAGLSLVRKETGGCLFAQRHLKQNLGSRMEAQERKVTDDASSARQNVGAMANAQTCTCPKKQKPRMSKKQKRAVRSVCTQVVKQQRQKPTASVPLVVIKHSASLGTQTEGGQSLEKQIEKSIQAAMEPYNEELKKSAKNHAKLSTVVTLQRQVGVLTTSVQAQEGTTQQMRVPHTCSAQQWVDMYKTRLEQSLQKRDSAASSVRVSPIPAERDLWVEGHKSTLEGLMKLKPIITNMAKLPIQAQKSMVPTLKKQIPFFEDHEHKLTELVTHQLPSTTLSMNVVTSQEVETLSKRVRNVETNTQTHTSKLTEQEKAKQKQEQRLSHVEQGYKVIKSIPDEVLAYIQRGDLPSIVPALQEQHESFKRSVGVILDEVITRQEHGISALGSDIKGCTSQIDAVRRIQSQVAGGWKGIELEQEGMKKTMATMLTSFNDVRKQSKKHTTDMKTMESKVTEMKENISTIENHIKSQIDSINEENTLVYQNISSELGVLNNTSTSERTKQTEQLTKTQHDMHDMSLQVEGMRGKLHHTTENVTSLVLDLNGVKQTVCTLEHTVIGMKERQEVFREECRTSIGLCEKTCAHGQKLFQDSLKDVDLKLGTCLRSVEEVRSSVSNLDVYTEEKRQQDHRFAEQTQHQKLVQYCNEEMAPVLCEHQTSEWTSKGMETCKQEVQKEITVLRDYIQSEEKTQMKAQTSLETDIRSRLDTYSSNSQQVLEKQDIAVKEQVHQILLLLDSERKSGLVVDKHMKKLEKTIQGVCENIEVYKNDILSIREKNSKTNALCLELDRKASKQEKLQTTRVDSLETSTSDKQHTQESKYTQLYTDWHAAANNTNKDIKTELKTFIATMMPKEVSKTTRELEDRVNKLDTTALSYHATLTSAVEKLDKSTQKLERKVKDVDIHTRQTAEKLDTEQKTIYHDISDIATNCNKLVASNEETTLAHVHTMQDQVQEEQERVRGDVRAMKQVLEMQFQSTRERQGQLEESGFAHDDLSANLSVVQTNFGKIQRHMEDIYTRISVVERGEKQKEIETYQQLLEKRILLMDSKINACELSSSVFNTLEKEQLLKKDMKGVQSVGGKLKKQVAVLSFDVVRLKKALNDCSYRLCELEWNPQNATHNDGDSHNGGNSNDSNNDGNNNDSNNDEKKDEDTECRVLPERITCSTSTNNNTNTNNNNTNNNTNNTNSNTNSTNNASTTSTTGTQTIQDQACQTDHLMRMNDNDASYIPPQHTFEVSYVGHPQYAEDDMNLTSITCNNTHTNTNTNNNTNNTDDCSCCSTSLVQCTCTPLTTSAEMIFTPVKCPKDDIQVDSHTDKNTSDIDDSYLQTNLPHKEATSTGCQTVVTKPHAVFSPQSSPLCGHSTRCGTSQHACQNERAGCQKAQLTRQAADAIQQLEEQEQRPASAPAQRKKKYMTPQSQECRQLQAGHTHNPTEDGQTHTKPWRLGTK